MDLKKAFEAAKGIPRQERRPTYVDSINQHPLTQHVMEYLNPLMPFFLASAMQWAKDQTSGKDLLKLENALAIKKNRRDTSQFSEKQGYTLETFGYIASLLSAVGRLEEIQVYIGGFPQPRTYEKLGITQDKWIHYHYSHYTVVMVGIYDTALLLTNAVFILGLDPKNCNKDTVVENRHVKRTDVSRAFSKLDVATARYRQPRNLYAHRSEIPKLELLDILELFSYGQRSKETMLDPKLLDVLYRLARNEITIALDEEVGNVVEALLALLSSLDEIYLSKFEGFVPK